jgi:hypothetical protein
MCIEAIAHDLKSHAAMLLPSCFLFRAASGDSERAFLKRNEKYNGEWEYDGSGSLTDLGDLRFGPTPNYPTGYAWFTQRLPSEFWSATLSFTFAPLANAAELGIWLTKDFGPQGPVFGGPIQFTGVALLCLYNNGKFEFELRENDGRGVFAS